MLSGFDDAFDGKYTQHHVVCTDWTLERGLVYFAYELLEVLFLDSFVNLKIAW